MNVTKAILSLIPNAQFAITNGNYDTIEWRDSRTKPSKGEVDTEVSRLIAAEPMRILKIERDKRLTDSDWVVTKAMEEGTSVPSTWKAYRQALRDLPASATPSFGTTTGGNFDIGITGVTWPTKPS